MCSSRVFGKFFVSLCSACIFVIITPLVSFAGETRSFFPPISPQANLNIAQITQSLAALALVSAFLERSIEIFFRVFNQSPSEPTDQDRQNKQRNIQVSTFIFGMIISCIGIRGLEPLFASPEDILQLSLFRLIDIILTGILISEGTAGVHKILTSLTAFLDATAMESKKKIVADTQGVVPEVKQ